MYLVIGDERDPCEAAVRGALQRHGRRVVVSPNPFGPPHRVSWTVDARDSRLVHAFGLGDGEVDPTLDGVFLRSFVALGDPEGWDPEDAGYVNAESTAALLAWLHALRCPVVGRPGDDAWYRAQRPLPEWVRIFAACGLRTPAVVITSSPDPAALPDAWSGRVTYHPLTSARYYPIQGTAWPELAKVAQHVPVCLCEPLDGPEGTVTLAGDRVFWTRVPARDRDSLEDCVRRVGARIGIDFLQLTFHVERDGPTFTAATLRPQFEAHDPATQDDIAGEIVRRLVTPEPREAGEAAPSVAEVLA